MRGLWSRLSINLDLCYCFSAAFDCVLDVSFVAAMRERIDRERKKKKTGGCARFPSERVPAKNSYPDEPTLLEQEEMYKTGDLEVLFVAFDLTVMSDFPLL